MDQELIAYLDRRFAEVSRRFDQQDQRFDQQGRRIDELQESHRHTQVVVEGLRSDVQAVAEGVITVDQKLERFREDVDRRFEEMGDLLQAGFETQHQKNAEFDRRITRLEAAQARPAGG